MKLSFLVVLVATAQAQVRVEGIVADTAGNPIGGAQVRMGGVQLPTHSGPDGTFAFDNVAPWGYTFSVVHAGFASLRDASYIEVSDQPVTGVRIVMAKQSVIAGRVISSSGDPVSSVSVSALERSYQNGTRRLVPAGSAMTDKNGEYRIGGLAPGSYVVQVGGTGGGSSIGRGSFGMSLGPPQDHPVATFYPSAVEESDAQRIDVSEGSEHDGIDIRRRDEIRYTIRGQLRDAEGQPLERVPMSIQEDGTTSIDEAVRMGVLTLAKTTRTGDGGFEFRNLAPGRYWIVSPGQSGAVRWERFAVTVTDNDVEGVIVRAGAGPDGIAGLEVTARVLMEDGSEPLNGLDVALVETPMAAAASTRSTRKGQPLRFAGLAPGNYRLDIRNLPADLYIKSIRMGDRDVTREVMAIRQPETLQVVLSDQPGYIQGALRPAGTRVILWPAEPRPEWAALGVWPAMADQNGVFRFAGVPPGLYYLAAWETVPGHTDTYYDFVNRFRGEALPVDVPEGASLTVEAPLIPAARITGEFEKLP